MSEKSQEKQTKKKKKSSPGERYTTRSPRLRLEEDIETQA
jgi:hypothetical protein